MRLFDAISRDPCQGGRRSTRLAAADWLVGCPLDKNACRCRLTSRDCRSSSYEPALRFTPRLQSPSEKAFVDGCNSGANRRNLHEKPPGPMGGRSYLSAIDMPVVEPMVIYIWDLCEYHLTKCWKPPAYYFRS